MTSPFPKIILALLVAVGIVVLTVVVIFVIKKVYQRIIQNKTVDGGSVSKIKFPIFGIGIIGLILCCLLIVIIILLLPNITQLFGSNPKPNHYGVFFKTGNQLIELDEVEIFGIPTTGDITSSGTIAAPELVLLVWQDNLRTDYLELYQVGANRNQTEQLQFTVTPKNDGIIEISPKGQVSNGTYCLVQGDPLAAFLSGWCFDLYLRK